MLRVCVVGLLLSWLVFPQAALWQHTGAAAFSAAEWLRHQTVIVLGGTPRRNNAGAEGDIDKLSPVNGFPASEIRCLALAMYHEAGTERAEAQIAVAQIALNRAASFKHAKAICRAIYTGINTPHGCLFNASCRNIGSTPPPSTALNAAAALAVEIAAGRATSKPAFEKASHFHDMKVSPPPWTRDLHRIGRLGRLDFYAPDASEETDQVETAAAAAGAGTPNIAQPPRANRITAPPRRPAARAEPDSDDLAQQAFGR
jgi:hypothetical protein